MMRKDKINTYRCDYCGREIDDSWDIYEVCECGSSSYSKDSNTYKNYIERDSRLNNIDEILESKKYR